MKDYLFTATEQKAQILESNIFLEIENLSGQRIVIHRTIKGRRDKNLISVTFGPELTSGRKGYESKDYFVSRSGAATRERGFHKFLAEFLGWNIPAVHGYDGKEKPLYLECIFPFFIVEQKRGWSTLNPPVPTRFRIKEPHKRTIEFIIQLDAQQIARRRIDLNNRSSRVEREWATILREIKAIAQAAKGLPRSLPSKPISKWPPEIQPLIRIPVEDNWVSLETQLKSDKDLLRELVSQQIPSVEETVQTNEEELSILQESLKRKEVALSQVLNTLEMERGELISIEIRLENIAQDIRHNNDVKTLQSLGSVETLQVNKHQCPTCHQQLEDSLLPLIDEQQVMSIDDNIKFLDEQKKIYLGVYEHTKQLIEAREIQVSQLREQFMSDRAKIRSLQKTLISDNRLPSMEAIRQQVETQERINRNEYLINQFYSKLGELEPLSEEWFEIELEKGRLPKKDVSDSDKKKLTLWDDFFVQQLREYGFQSLPIREVNVSRDTYAPSHEGFDLPSNISASDLIRIIWAYLTGLLEVSSELNTNHPGFLIFDEPRQQSTDKFSFHTLLKRASRSIENDHQIIFATSENVDNLDQMLDSVPHTLLSFDGRIIQPLN